MNIGLGIGIPFTRSSLWASIFTPSALFLDGSTQGVWYDPSDINLTWRRNLLTYSEQFDNAVWNKTSTTVTPNAAIAPDGTTTADKLIADTSNAVHALNFTSNSVLGACTRTVYAKAGEVSRIEVSAYYPSTDYAAAIFNLSSGTVVFTTAGDTATISSISDGWYRCSLTTTRGGSTNFGSFSIRPNIGGGQNGAFTGDGTSGIYIWGAQLEVGSTASTYQRITDGIQDYFAAQPLPVLYRDAAGTQPVTAVEQPVGLMLDKSKGLVLGPELVTNGDFSNGSTGWAFGNASWSVSGGRATNDGTNGVYASLVQSGIIVAGKFYVVEWDQTTTSGSVNLWFAGTQSVVSIVTGSGRKSLKVRATVSGSLFFEASIGGVLSIDNISVRELPGNHAFNPSGNSANFPVLSARYNEFEKTEQFDNAYWGKVGCVVSAPELVGTVLANKVTPSGTNFVNKVITRTGKVRFSVKPNGVRYLLLYQYGSSTFKDAVFDLQLATITRAAAGVSASISLRPDGFLDLAITQSDVVSIESGVQAVDAGTSPANQSYAGGGSYYLSRADLRVANDALNQPAYQRVNTSTDYDTVGFKPYLRFNGTNQWLQTNSIDFTYGDKMFVCAGVRKLSDAAQAIVVETSTSNGTFTVAAPRNAVPNYAWTSRGTLNVEATAPSSYSAPITNVVSGIGDISGSQSVIRVNSSQVANNSASQGTGNYSNLPLYIGARAGTSLFFNGRLYQLVIAAGSEIRVAEEDSDLFLSESGDFITAETTVAVIQSAIEQTEAFVNRKTKAF